MCLTDFENFHGGNSPPPPPRGGGGSEFWDRPHGPAQRITVMIINKNNSKFKIKLLKT